MKIALIIFMYLVWIGSAMTFADMVHLKSGRTVEGDIIEQTDEYIKIDAFGVTITYYNEEIERVDVVVDDEAISSDVASEIEAGVVTENTQAQEVNTYIDEEYGISISGPKGWDIKQVEKTGRTKQLLVTFSKPTAGKTKMHSSITVLVEDISQDEGQKPLSEYIENDILSVRESCQDLKVVEGPKEEIVNGNKLQLLLLEYKHNDLSISDLAYYYIKDSQKYTISGSFPTDDFEDDYKYFQESINSLRIE